jgi:hypothetical protein
MGKVVTSKGLTEFVQEGTVEHVENHKAPKAKEAPVMEAKKEDPVVDLKAPEVKEEKEPEKDEEVPVLSEDSRKYVNKQHRLRKEAQEAAEDAERFAKDQYTRAMLAEQRAEQLARDLEATRKTVEKPKEPELKAPEAKDFMVNDQVDWDKYTDAKADYRAKLAVQEERKRIQDERAEKDRQEHISRIQAEAQRVRKEFPDFDSVMENAKDTEADIVPQFVLNYVYESDHSALVAYHLAKNPEETQRIAKLPPIRGLAELGKLEERLTTKAEAKEPPKERTGAPPPITPISSTSSGTVNTDPSKMSFAELRAYEKARRKR